MYISSTVLIGCGGTGGHLAAPLSRLLSYHNNSSSSITLVDGDDFEQHNTERQHAGPAQVGVNKAEWTSDLCATQGLDAAHVSRYLDKTLLHSLLRKETGVALVVAAVDNDATRKICIDYLVNDRKDNFVFVTPGNSAGTSAIKGNVLWFGRADDQDYGIDPSLVFPNIEHPQDAAPRYGSCATQAPGAPQLITANVIAAAYTLAVVQNLLDDAIEPHTSCCFFNGRTFTTSFS